MSELDRFIGLLLERIEAGLKLSEEPGIELKAQWPTGTETDDVWGISDLVAALANDPHLDGFRTIIYGPNTILTRPSWLVDESVLRPKMLKHFEGAVVPRVELLRRELQSGELVDFLVVVDQSEAPYVTRQGVGGEWVVRVRSNTGRRTATRAEILALAKGHRRMAAVRKLDARVDKPNGMRRLTVTNVGTIGCRDIEATLPEGVEASWNGSSDRSIRIADRLEPGDREARYFFAGFDSMGGSQGSFTITVESTGDDGEAVEASVRASPNL